MIIFSKLNSNRFIKKTKNINKNAMSILEISMRTKYTFKTHIFSYYYRIICLINSFNIKANKAFLFGSFCEKSENYTN